MEFELNSEGELTGDLDSEIHQLQAETLLSIDTGASKSEFTSWLTD